jgi:glycosyltransferase involved in cell wall biosynthesis
MHILIDAINDNEVVRGPDRYLLGLLSGLAEIDGDNFYTLCHAPWQAAFRDVALPDNFRRQCLDPPRGRTARVAWHAFAFPRLARAMAPDLVHLPNIIFAPIWDRPVVMTVHDLAHFHFPEKFGPVRGRAQRLLIRRALRVPRHVIAVSRFTRTDLAKLLGVRSERVHEVHEGAPAARPGVAPREGAGPPYFLYVGQLERSKNVEGLIEAFSASEALRAAGVELRIVGKPGNAGERIAALTRRLGDPRVKLLGYVPEDRLSELYAGCLAFVFPSLIEGFGLVLLEAMAHGAPVIAMRTSAIPEVVDDAGCLIDPAQPEALRQAMELLHADDGLRQRLRERGYARLKRFSWTEAARSTLAIYREALQ